MKKYLCLFFFILFFNVYIFPVERVIYKETFVDEWGKGDNAVELNIFYPGMLVGIRYERKVEDNLSFGCMFFYNFAGRVNSIGGRIEGNFYINNRALNSFFVGPFLSLYNLNVSDKTGLFFGSGINIGYRWIFDGYTFSPRITLQYGIGPESEENIRAGASGFSYGVGISGGVVF